MAQRFYVLDGMRGVAALAVLTAHLPWYFGPYVFGESVLPVDLFFCLSGFVMASAYSNKLDATMGVPKWFFVVRIIRLYPLYLAGTILGILSYWITPDPKVPITVTAVVLSLVMLPTPGAADMWIFPFNLPAWSLLFELMVNCGWAFWRKATRFWAVGVVLLGSLAMMMMAIVISHFHAFGAVGWTWMHFPFGLARAIFSFTMGLLVYRLYLHKKLGACASSTAALALYVALALSMMPSISGYARGAYELVVVVAIFPALVYLGAQVQPGPKTAQICSFLGVTSYGVYMLHSPLGNALKSSGIDIAGDAPWSAVVFVVTILALTWMVDKVYDLPVRHWLTGLYRGRIQPMRGAAVSPKEMISCE